MDAAGIGAPPAVGKYLGARVSRGADPARRHAWYAARLPLAVACALAWAAAATAQDTPAPPPQPPPQAGPPALSDRLEPGSVVRLLGRDVKGAGGEVVAQIVNLLVDASGAPRAAILDYGGFLGVGKRRIAVAWRTLAFAPGEGAGAITLSLDREQLKNFPEYKPEGPVFAAVPPVEDPVPAAADAPPADRE
jgi:hypothetical protein